MKDLIEAVSYKPGWSIELRQDKPVLVHHVSRRLTEFVDGRPYIQVKVEDWTEAALSPHTGERSAWKGGKRYLSYHMCRQEIVGACLDAIKAAEMHELHEWFKYKGRSIYNPHIDPDALVDLVKYAKNLNVRENAMSMDEEEPLVIGHYKPGNALWPRERARQVNEE